VGETVLLVKPLSYMNLSCGPVARLAAEHCTTPADLVAVVDDVALPLGRIRVRPGGSDGGHNGLRSLVLSLGTEEFARVRIGVGVDPPPALDLADFVLGEFLEEERPRVREAVSLAADAVACLVEAGTAVAMNRFNGPRGRAILAIPAGGRRASPCGGNLAPGRAPRARKGRAGATLSGGSRCSRRRTR